VLAESARASDRSAKILAGIAEQAIKDHSDQYQMK